MTVMNGAHIYRLCREVHADNVAAGWWSDPKNGQRIDRNVGELLMLITSELCEGAEGIAGNLMDDKLPHRQMIEVELADFAIRVFDFGGGIDIAERISIEFDLARNAGNLATTYSHIDTPNDFLLRIIRFVSEAMEHDRKGRTQQIGKPMAYALHGAFILGEILDLDVPGAIDEKRAFNATRADHKIENRLAVGGKAY